MNNSIIRKYCLNCEWASDYPSRGITTCGNTGAKNSSLKGDSTAIMQFEDFVVPPECPNILEITVEHGK